MKVLDKHLLREEKRQFKARIKEYTLLYQRTLHWNLNDKLRKLHILYKNKFETNYPK